MSRSASESSRRPANPQKPAALLPDSYAPRDSCPENRRQSAAAQPPAASAARSPRTRQNKPSPPSDKSLGPLADSITYPPKPRCVSLNIRAPQCRAGVAVMRSISAPLRPTWLLTLLDWNRLMPQRRSSPQPNQLRRLPPLHRFDSPKSKIADQVLDTMRHNRQRSSQSPPPHLPRNCPQRRPDSSDPCAHASTAPHRSAARSRTRNPARRCRRKTISRVANTGSTSKACPPSESENDECPINVIAVSLRANFRRLRLRPGQRPLMALTNQPPQLPYLSHPKRNFRLSYIHLTNRCQGTRNDPQNRQ